MDALLMGLSWLLYFAGIGLLVFSSWLWFDAMTREEGTGRAEAGRTFDRGAAAGRAPRGVASGVLANPYPRPSDEGGPEATGDVR